MRDPRLLAAFGFTEGNKKYLKFFRMCSHSRREKKPVLMIVVNNPNFDSIIQSLLEKSGHTADMVMNSYNLIFVSKEQVEQKLLNGNSKYFSVPQGDDFVIFVLFIKHQHNISIMQRLRQWQIEDPDMLQRSLQEFLGLFSIMSEEDQGYRNMQLLQDAGLVPIRNQAPPISHNIPQSAIDEMMRAEEEIKTLTNTNNNDHVMSEDKQSEKIPDMPIEKPLPPPELPELADAPNAEDPDSCEIVFKLPGSGERINRRFLKSDKAETLYKYIEYLYLKGDCSFEIESTSNMGAIAHQLNF